MNKLLAVILSICLLLSSVTPSLAQLVPAGRQAAKGLTGRGSKAVADIVRKNAVKGLLPSGAAAVSAAATAAGLSRAEALGVPARNASTQMPHLSSSKLTEMRSQIDLSIQRQLPVTGNQIRALVKEGKTDGLAERILNHPNLAFREGLLRNEFVTVALKGAATDGQIAQALSFYRADLAKNSVSFAQLPKADLTALLQIARTPEHASYQTVIQSQQALSSAAALGLLGGPNDGAALLQFYEQAVGSSFQSAAATIAARGLLRQGAYRELQELADFVQAKDAFWQDIAARTSQTDHPLRLASAETAAADTAVDPALSVFLRAGCSANALNANLSRVSTDKWLSFGKKPVAVAVKTQAGVSRQIANPLPLELPKITLPQADLDVAPLALAEENAAASAGTRNGSVGTSAASVPAAQPVQPLAGKTSQKTIQFFAKSAPESSSGLLYSGLPLFSSGKGLRKAFAWLKEKFSKTSPRPAAKRSEVPGLHDNSEISEVFSDLRSPEAPASADEVIGANETGFVPVSEKGFKLTLVDEAGVERILPVNLEISNRFHLKGYNRIAFAMHHDFHNGYVAELRNQEHDPKPMNHFYMRLQSNQVGALVDLIRASGIEKFSLKLEERANISYKTVKQPVYDAVTNEKLPLEVEVPAKKFPDGAKLVLLESGELGILKAGQPAPMPAKKAYVRIPKNQIANLVKVLRFSPMVFNISMHPTQNRVYLVMTEASLTNVSLGKTMGAVVNNALGVSVSSANSMMFTINYILPGLASLLTPVLKKYGEKKMMVLSLIMSSAAGLLASAGGFYGFVEGMTLGPVSKALFITALFLMSGSSILKQLVSNMLIRANRGEVVLTDAKNDSAVETEQTALPRKQGFAKMGQRLKQVFTEKSKVSLKDIVLYNMSFVYKNVGTLAFLASPYLINYGIRLTTGVDLGIDYSVSFPIYALYSGAVAWKMWRAKLRDAYSAKNLEQSQKNLEGVLSAGAKVLAELRGKPSAGQVDDAARAFKDALDALVFADLKLDPGQKKAELYAAEKEKFFQQLTDKLVREYGLPPTRVEATLGQIKHSMAIQENTVGNMLKMIKVPGVASLASAMTLATIHEFVVSSTFSSTMKQLVNQGEFANFLIACSLYVPLIIGRLGGNFLSRRVSADSMYIFCSALSALGTAVMATAGNSVAQIIAGAAIASFGIGNFFTQMYDYIMNRYPKHNRELSSILALTMALGGLGAIPAGYLAAMTGMEVSSLAYAGAALAASLMLTPGMMAHSSLVQGMKYEAKRLWKGIKKLFTRKSDKPGENDGSLDDAAPVQ